MFSLAISIFYLFSEGDAKRGEIWKSVRDEILVTINISLDIWMCAIYYGVMDSGLECLFVHGAGEECNF